jgi:hypothetical protein
MTGDSAPWSDSQAVGDGLLQERLVMWRAAFMLEVFCSVATTARLPLPP